MDMDKEYLMLREEILHVDTVINNTISFFYVFIASYLAFALTQEDTVFILLAYIVIIPAHLIVTSKMRGMTKIGAYLYFFYERSEKSKFHWESRNIKFKDKNKDIFSHVLSGDIPFILVGLFMLLLHIYQIDWSNRISKIETIKLGINAILMITVWILALKNRKTTIKKYILSWEKVANESDIDITD